jgi:hypothetical protein
LRQPICIEHEVVIEIATNLAGRFNFGPDLKVAVSQVQRRFFRQERLLNQSGASYFLLLPLLGEDLVSKAAKCSGVLGELRRGACKVVQNSPVEFSPFQGREGIRVKRNGSIHRVDLSAQLLHHRHQEFWSFFATVLSPPQNSCARGQSLAYVYGRETKSHYYGELPP